MDAPLLRLAQAAGLATTGSHEWPEHVDEDIAEFVAAPDARAIFVVEHADDGLVIGPPPKMAGDVRVLAIAKPAGTLNAPEWDREVVAVAMPVNAALFRHLHSLTGQVVLPLLEAPGSSESTSNARNKLLEAERALSSLLQHQHVAFVDLVGGWGGRVKRALEANDLNELQAITNAWKRAISQLAASDRDVRQGTASDEVGFWATLEEALRSAETQLKSPDVASVIDALERAKRFHATHNFVGDTGLPEAITRVAGYQLMFKDLALGELLAAQTFPQLAAALDAIFAQLARRLRMSGYPILRSVLFVEAIGRDFATVLSRLADHALDDLVETDGHLPSFARTVAELSDAWDGHVRDFASLARELMRKRAERFVIIRVNPSHTALATRVRAIENLWLKHNELHPLVGAELDAAFEQVMSTKGLLQLDNSEWRRLESTYAHAAHVTEQAVAETLRVKLESAGTDAQRFEIFEQHRAVLSRPEVRAVIHQFQNALATRIRADLAGLQARTHALPSRGHIVDRVVSMKALGLRVEELLHRTAAVLGSDWRAHADGAALAADCGALQSQLDMKREVDDWLASIDFEKELKGPVFVSRQGKLLVSAQPTHIYSDIRALRALGFRFDPAIVRSGELLCEQELTRSRLSDCMNDLLAVRKQLSTYPRVISVPTIHSLLQQVMVLVRAGLTEVSWESEHLVPFINTLEQTLLALSSRVAQVSSADAEISTTLQDMTKSPQEIRERIQELSSSTVIVPEYTDRVSEDLNRVINSRCAELLAGWKPPKSVHRVEVRNQVILIVPELTATLEAWLRELNTIVRPVMSTDKQLLAAYGRAVAKAGAELRSASSRAAEWLAFQPLWDLRFEPVALELGSNIPRWLETLGELRRMRNRLHSHGTQQECIEINTSETRTLVDAKCDVWQDELVSKFAELISSQSLDLSTRLRRAHEGLESIKFDVNGLLPSLLALSQADTLVDESDEICNQLQQADQLLTRSRFAFPQQWMYADRVANELAALKVLVSSRKSSRDAAKPRLIENLKGRLTTLNTAAQHLLTSWIANKPLQASVEAEAALDVLSRFQLDINKLFGDFKSVSDALTTLDADYKTSIETEGNMHAELETAMNDIEHLEAAWASLQDCWISIREIGKRRWFETNINDLRRDIRSLKARIDEIPQRTQQLRAYERLVKDVDTRVEACEQIVLLRESSAIQVHHLSKILNVTLPKEPVLDDIWLRLPEPATISAIVESAEGELQLSKYVDDVEAQWMEMKLIGRDLALRNLSSVIQLVTDHLAAFSAMRASPHFSALNGVVQGWEQRLTQASQVFDQFVDVQRQFVYLRGVLSARSVQAILPNETRRFRIVNDEFAQIFSAAVGQRALEFAAETRIAPHLGRLRGQLTQLHRSLATFLESQRKRFARFFFIGDDDLLEIVGASISEWGWKHLPSIFPGVASLEVQGLRVVAVKSPEGEQLDVDVKLVPEDNVEFLIRLEEAMQKSLHSEILKAASQVDAVWNDPSKFIDWLQTIPCQAILVALRAQWSRISIQGAAHKVEYESLLQCLAENGEHNSLLMSRRREAIISELSHQASHLSPRHPELDIRVEIRDSEVVLHCGSHSWKYGYEYVGVPEIHVRTPLTDDFFFAATTAIAQGLGGSVIGPAGTGKTESVKALGSLFGRRVVVFNCDETFDFDTVSRVINGCAKTQGWACFDEFNRLNRKVLSSVAQLISESVSKHTPVFVTMNPGYAGRTLLPPNMRPQFREFVMAAPDSRDIAHVLLYAQGLIDKSIGDAAVELLTRMSANATKQKHYDWGLRTLKGVLRLCRLLHGSVRLACEVSVRPRLVPDDLEVFDTQIKDLFGKSEGEISIPGDLELSNSSSKETLKPFIRSLDRFLKLFTGVILLGPPACGKSSAWRELADLRGAKSVVLDPSAMSKSSIFGWLDPTTREWTDGLLTSTLRQVSNNLRGEQTHPWFIIFDGEVEPEWAETLNSVLDDNRRLTLPTGEILSLPSNVHLIFETTSLQAATPATVSRCGILFRQDFNLDDDPVPPEVFKTARNIEHAMGFSTQRALETYNALDLENKYLSLAWALAGDSNQEGREKISNAIRDSTTENLPPGALTEYYVSGLTGQWHLWSDSVAPCELNEDAITRPELVIPTEDTAAHEALLQAALRSRRPLLLVGPPGSGKTMTLFNALRQLPQVVLIPLNFSTTSTPEVIVKALELHCEYSTSLDGSKILGPAGMRWAALFIDEINLPTPNKNDVVVTTQFLRQMIELGGFYDKHGTFVKLERVQLVGACNPPPTRRPLPERLIRHFAVIQVGYPSRASLRTIYTSLLGSFSAHTLIEPMLQTYDDVKRILPQEIWSPRELTRWTRGIYTAWTATSESQHSLPLLYQLWFVEGRRILADRLRMEEQSIVFNILKERAPTDITIPGVWTYIMTQRPQFMPLKSCREFLASRLSVFVEEAASEGDSRLVIHDEFVEHALRVDRILRQPQGHALLAGPHCTGKVTVIRFVCWLSGLEVVRLRTHALYGEPEFTRDLRRVLLVSLRRPVCFIVAEDAFLEPLFVESMNSLLANGEVPGLFDSHELAAELEEACRRAGFTGGEITPWFRQRVVSNLHVVFTATTFENMSPALLNRCYVDQINSWDLTAKKQIAKYWTSNSDLNAAVVDAMSVVSCAGHEFLEFCFQMAHTYKIRMRDIDDTQRHFVGGGDRLKEAVLEIAQLKRKLDAKRLQLDEENSQSAKVLSLMLQNQSEAERKRATAVEIRAAVQAQTSQIERRRAEAHNDLAATQPMIDQAAQGVQNIRKVQLNELRGFTNPPEPVKITLEAVCLILGLFTDGTWRQVLAAVRSDEFIPRILHFDSSRLHANMVVRIEQDYMSLPSFTYERVDRASKACGPLLRWVVAQVAYSKALASVQPLLSEVESLNSQAAESTAQLQAIESMLEDLETAIDSAKLEYSSAIAKCESIKSEIASVGNKLERSEALLRSLQGEQDRWSECASQFNERKSVVAGNSFIEAGFIALGGQRDSAARRDLFDELKTVLELHEIAFNFVGELSSEEIASRSESVTLIVDPAKRWSCGENVKKTSFLLDPDALLKELDTALRFGQHIVIEHAERYDPFLAPLLSKEFVRRGARLLVTLRGNDIDVAPGFRLTLQARDYRALRQNQPYLLSRVNLIDFSVSENTFKELVSDELLVAKMPDLAKRRTDLLELDTTTQKRLRSLESQLLNTLADSRDSGLLENAALLNALETLKTEATQLEHVRANTNATLLELNEAHDQYSSAASAAAQIYVAVQEVSSWDPFYVVSVDWLCTIARNCAPKESFEAAFTKEVFARISLVVRFEHRQRLADAMSAAAGCPVNTSETFDLVQFIAETPNTVPVIVGMATPKTVDPGSQIAASTSNPASIVAMGSNQAAARADRLLGQAIELGEWLIIQNIELAEEDWLRSLARRLQASQPTCKFRLVLSGMQQEIVDMPDVLSTGRPVSVESSEGVVSELRASLEPESDERDSRLCWVHACFSKAFSQCNFVHPDLMAARWFAKEITDWGPLQAALISAVYGAKTGNAGVRLKMTQFLEKFLTESSVPPPNFSSKDWPSEIPQSESWVPRELVDSSIENAK